MQLLWPSVQILNMDICNTYAFIIYMDHVRCVSQFFDLGSSMERRMNLARNLCSCPEDFDSVTTDVSCHEI